MGSVFLTENQLSHLFFLTCQSSWMFMEILYATVTCLSKMGKYPIEMATQSKQTLGGGLVGSR